eukprot:gene22805-31957_t
MVPGTGHVSHRRLPLLFAAALLACCPATGSGAAGQSLSGTPCEKHRHCSERMHCGGAGTCQPCAECSVPPSKGGACPNKCSALYYASRESNGNFSASTPAPRDNEFGSGGGWESGEGGETRTPTTTAKAAPAPAPATPKFQESRFRDSCVPAFEIEAIMAARGGAAGKASGGGQGSLQVKVKNGKSLAPGDVFIRLIPGSGQGARDSVKGKKKKKLQTTVKKKAQHQNWDEQFDDIDYEEGMVLTVEVCHKRRFKEPLVPAVHNLDIASLHLVNLSPKDHTIEFSDGSSLDLTLVVDDGESLFGLSIGLAAKREKQDIPTIVTTCIDTITRGPRGLKIEGLYRIPGKASAIKEFKAAFNASHEYKFKDGINPNWIASLLKQYFRDLPDPLFTTNLYADFIACVPKGAD